MEGVDFALGGNAANVAVGLSKLGFNLGLYSLHGDDETGRIIDEKILKEGISPRFVESQKGRSSYSTIINFKGERTILEKKYAVITNMTIMQHNSAKKSKAIPK